MCRMFGSKFRHICQVATLARHRIRYTCQSPHQRLVIHVADEGPAFRYEPEVSDPLDTYHQLSIKSTSLGLPDLKLSIKKPRGCQVE